MRRIGHGLLLALVLVLSLVPLAAAQSTIEVSSSEAEARFRQHIVFRLVAEAQTEINEVMLFYQVGEQPAVNRVSPDFESGTRVEISHTWDLSDGSLPPGVEVTYWWRIGATDGGGLETEPQSLIYLDERHEWQSLSSERLVLYWYRGDEDFGQALFDRGEHALDTLSQDVGVVPARQSKVFIYGSHADLLDAIAEGSKEWTGGQAFPDVGVVVIGVAPGDLAWGQRAVAHELTHLVVHQVVDTPLGDLPQWLDEGLAMYGEGSLEPSYQYDLEQAMRRDELISVQSLSSPFPADPDQARLAYAESYSLVQFILETYGRDTMSELLQVFAEGAYADDALTQVLGVDSGGLDAAWRDWMNAPPVRPEPLQSQPSPAVSQPRWSVPAPLLLVVLGSLLCLGGVAIILLVVLLVILRRR